MIRNSVDMPNNTVAWAYKAGFTSAGFLLLFIEKYFLILHLISHSFMNTSEVSPAPSQ